MARILTPEQFELSKQGELTLHLAQVWRKRAKDFRGDTFESMAGVMANGKVADALEQCAQELQAGVMARQGVGDTAEELARGYFVPKPWSGVIARFLPATSPDAKIEFELDASGTVLTVTVGDVVRAGLAKTFPGLKADDSQWMIHPDARPQNPGSTSALLKFSNLQLLDEVKSRGIVLPGDILPGPVSWKTPEQATPVEDIGRARDRMIAEAGYVPMIEEVRRLLKTPAREKLLPMLIEAISDAARV